MKRMIAMLLACVLLLSMAPAVYAYEAPVSSYNKDDHFYVNAQRYKTTVNSTLEVTENGYTRVECVGNSLVVEAYGWDFQFVSGREIPLELPIYGGVYLCEDYNFVVVGQTNLEEDDTKEVFRIIRYSKDWVRQDSASICGANTTVPFDAGSLRFARSGNMLYIRTAHEMYTSSDGLNHQANVMIAVRISDMTVTDQLTKVLNVNYGYVSHSFNQFVLVDGNDLLAVDHGDYYPRSVVLFKYKNPAGQETFYGRVNYVEPLKIVNSTGHYNDTGVSVGGFEASSDHYLIAGCSADQTEECNLMYAHRNIFVTATPKADFSDEATTVRWLTAYGEEDDVQVSPPYLVKLSADRFFLMWTENGQIRYCTINGKGEPEGEILPAEGDLSDCVPVVDGNKVVWYVTDGSAPKFYAIDPDVPAHVHNHTAVVTAADCTHGGFTTYTCECGDSYVAEETGALGHNIVNGKCTACGMTVSTVKRIYGANRYETAIKTAEVLKQTMGVEKFDAIVVASGEDFADALSGSYLANQHHAPILLVRNRKQEIERIKAYIQANLKEGGTVYLLGGTKAVPQAMETGLEKFAVKRLAGATRYETNLAILEEAGSAGRDVLVCTGKDFADGLSASAVNLPILLVKDSLSEEQKAWIQSQTGAKFYIVGGTNAVNTRIENLLLTCGQVTRIQGATRYITSVNLAQTFFPNADTAVLAYGANFPDGLSGGSLAFAEGAPLILAANGKQSYAVDWAREAGVSGGYVLGGSGLISDGTAGMIFGTESIAD